MITDYYKSFVLCYALHYSFCRGPPTAIQLTHSRCLAVIAWWAGLDSNQRRDNPAGLQPAAIATMRLSHINRFRWKQTEKLRFSAFLLLRFSILVDLSP